MERDAWWQHGRPGVDDGEGRSESFGTGEGTPVVVLGSDGHATETMAWIDAAEESDRGSVVWVRSSETGAMIPWPAEHVRLPDD